jgi:hypothetical protein
MRRSRSPLAIKRFAGFGYRRDPTAPVNRLATISRVETIRRDPTEGLFGITGQLTPARNSLHYTLDIRIGVEKLGTLVWWVE